MENLNVTTEPVEALENMGVVPEEESQEAARAEVANRQTRRRANMYFISKLVFNIFLLILGTLLIVLFLCVFSRNVHDPGSLGLPYKKSS